MTKADFIALIAEKTGMSKKDAAAYVTAVFEAIKEIVTNDDEIRIPDFGTFKLVHKASRKCYNPLTKEMMDLPESKVPSFKASKVFKDEVNQ